MILGKVEIAQQHVRHGNNTVIVQVVGALVEEPNEGRCEALRRTLIISVRPDTRRLVLDLREVPYANEEVLSDLIGTLYDFKHAGIEIVLVSAPKSMRSYTFRMVDTIEELQENP